MPRALVGVFTERNTKSAAAMAGSTAAEAWRVRPRQRATTTARPASTAGRRERFQIVPGGDAVGVEIHY